MLLKQRHDYNIKWNVSITSLRERWIWYNEGITIKKISCSSWSLLEKMSKKFQHNIADIYLITWPSQIDTTLIYSLLKHNRPRRLVHSWKWQFSSKRYLGSVITCISSRNFTITRTLDCMIRLVLSDPSSIFQYNRFENITMPKYSKFSRDRLNFVGSNCIFIYICTVTYIFGISLV